MPMIKLHYIMKTDTSYNFNSVTLASCRTLTRQLIWSVASLLSMGLAMTFDK